MTNCWFVAGLLYKIKLAEREATGPMDISNDLEAYQERLEMLRERGERGDGKKTEDEAAYEPGVDDDDAYQPSDGENREIAQTRAAARRGGGGARGRAGVRRPRRERPRRPVREPVPEGAVPLAHGRHRRRVARARRVEKAALRRDVSAAVLPVERHAGAVPDRSRHRGGVRPVAGLPEPAVLRE